MMQQDFLQYVAQTSDAPIIMPVDRAEGIYLYGPNGQKWIDFISGICVSNLGHGDSDILAAIHQQVDRYLHPMVYGEVIMSPQVRYAKRLAEVLGDGLESVYFVNSGTEAVEGALKVAKKFTGRGGIVSCFNAYHGSTHGAMSISGDPQAKQGYGPLLPEVSFIRFNEEEDLTMIQETTAAVCIEAIQGAGGVILPQEGYLQAVRKRCDEVGALLILDEIQTGFGRTGALFAHQKLNLKPDILLLAKSLGGGMPLGAFITRQEVMDVIRRDPPLGFITTFGGHPVSCAAGLALLEKLIHSDILASLPEKEQLLRTHLPHPAIQEIRGMGMIFAVLFESGEMAEQVREKALELGLLTIGFLNIRNGLRICPPLTSTPEELVEACRILHAAIDTVNEEV